MSGLWNSFGGPSLEELCRVSIPLNDFEHSVEAADQLVRMYVELRKFRNLGSRGRLTLENQDLLWMPRSAVVAAISALDAYIHSVLIERIPATLTAEPNMPSALQDEVVKVLPMKGNDFHKTWKVLKSGNVASGVSGLIIPSLSFNSYQAPEKVIAGYSLIGKGDVFDVVAGMWPGPQTTAKWVKDSLSKYVTRRNQIAHEGDREKGNSARAMQPKYATDCTQFIRDLVNRLDRVVYPN